MVELPLDIRDGITLHFETACKPGRGRRDLGERLRIVGRLWGPRCQPPVVYQHLDMTRAIAKQAEEIRNTAAFTLPGDWCYPSDLVSRRIEWRIYRVQ
jgi:hypothetical protein